MKKSLYLIETRKRKNTSFLFYTNKYHAIDSFFTIARNNNMKGKDRSNGEVMLKASSSTMTIKLYEITFDSMESIINLFNHKSHELL